MKKRSYVVLSMAIVRDTDAPKTDEEIIVIKKNGDMMDVPVCVQSFKNKEEFVKEITERASRLWDLHEKIIEENNNPELVEKEPTFKDMN